MVLVAWAVMFGSFLVLRGISATHIREVPTEEGAAYVDTTRRVKGKHDKITAYPSVVVPLKHPRSLWIRSEHVVHHGLRALGLADDLQIGDPELDANWYIATDSPDELRHLGRTPDLRSALAAVLALAPTRVRANHRSLCVELPSRDALAWDEEHRDDLAAHAAALADALDRAAPTEARNTWRLSLVMGVNAALAAGGMAAVAFEVASTITSFEPFAVDAGLGVTLALFWLSAIGLLLRDTGWIALAVTDFLLFGLLGAILSGPELMRSANIVLDDAPPEEHQVVVSATPCQAACTRGSGKRRSTRRYTLDRSYCTGDESAIRSHLTPRDSSCANSMAVTREVQLDGLPGYGGSYSFVTSREKYRQHAPGTRASVPVHPGALGVRWVDATEIVPGL